MSATDDPRVVAHCDAEGCSHVEPAPGWAWCPECNGDGVIATMDASPDLNERVDVCTACDDGLVEVSP